MRHSPCFQGRVDRMAHVLLQITDKFLLSPDFPLSHYWVVKVMLSNVIAGGWSVHGELISPAIT